MQQPSIKPANPNFSSGPCAKRPGWSPSALAGALVGRSHRSGPGKAKLAAVIDKTRAILGIPDDYRIGIVPASDTGAVEIALWSMLGARGVDVLVWESFSKDWMGDIQEQLHLDDVRVLQAGYGDLPDLAQVDPKRDTVFVWNGTTSGVRVPNGDWIAADREGLTICDATSAAFSMDLPWDKLDVVTWSWQKAMGGEAAHGMLVLSPRAVERLETFTPPRPLPKVFRLTKGAKLTEGIFRGETMNTPSMLCVEDALDALDWMEAIGGQPACQARSEQSLAHIAAWVERTQWAAFLPKLAATRSCTSVCLTVNDPELGDKAAEVPGLMAKRLDAAGIAYDINGYRAAPPGLRIWCGSTVEPDDVAALLPWLDWAFAAVKADLLKG
ncbi:MAG: phosphoserine transaminase [Alphaproteobacteria bacterium]|nr:phosphoserine transaminase [Alphaproteobacteria bacterium]MCB9928905.1 phosphoserine transaminase [Alphaproteobacteria bacterium]